MLLTMCYLSLSQTQQTNGMIIISTYNYVDEGKSIIEYDTAGTTVTGGVFIDTIYVAKGQSEIIDLQKYGFFLYPTQIFTITGKMTSGASSDLSASLSWVEEL